jgi:hypothetical protein
MSPKWRNSPNLVTLEMMHGMILDRVVHILVWRQREGVSNVHYSWVFLQGIKFLWKIYQCCFVPLT